MPPDANSPAARLSARARGPRAPARPGITLLETTLSVLLLGMLAATAVSVIGIVRSAQERQQVLLGAHELANQLMIQKVYNASQNKDTPEQGLPFAYGDETRPSTVRYYRWRVREQDASVIAAVGPNGSAPKAHAIQLFLVDVWLHEDSGGSVDFSEEVPHVRISRLYDVLNIGRNTDGANQLTGQDADAEALKGDFFQRIGMRESGGRSISGGGSDS